MRWSWVLAGIAAVEAADIIRVPLIPLSVPRKRVVQRGKLGGNFDKRDVGYAPLIDHVFPGSINQDIAYLGQVSLGNPPQSFLVGLPLSGLVDVDIDTGSGVLWVTDHTCRGCNVSNAHLYDTGQSNTEVIDGSDFRILYGKGIST